MRIGVIGTGGVGGYFGGKLAIAAERSGRGEVWFLARGAHLAAIRAGGLIVDSEDGVEVARPRGATDDVAELPPLDLCLLCVKGYDLPGVLPGLRDRVGAGTIVLPLLNGVDIPERVAAGLEGRGTVLPSCVYVGTHIAAPGRIEQRGGTRKIIYGFPGRRDAEPRLEALLEGAGIDSRFMEDPSPEIWGKFTFIAAFALVTADAGRSIGAVLADAALRATAASVMEEIRVIARARGVALSETIVEESLAKGATFPFGLKTSFQRDYEAAGKADERETLGGTVVRMGAALGIPTPETSALMASLEAKKPGCRPAHP